MALSGFLSSIGSNFIICSAINVHLDAECGDRYRFNDILQCCSLVQSVSGPTHILGHIVDIWYYQINIDQYCNDLNNIPFVLSPEGTAAELYDQYMDVLTHVLDNHALIISHMAKRQSDEWLSDSYCMTRSLRWQFE